MGQDYVPSWAKQKVETPEGALEVASAQEGSGRSERIAVAQEPLESKGLFETVGDYGVDRLPWIGTAKEFTEMGGLLMAARRAERGVASQYDMQMLNNWVAEQDRGHTFGGHVANIVGSIPKFALELVSSAGIGKAAVVVGKKGGQEATRALIRQVTREASGHAVKKATLAAMKRKAMLESTKRRAAAKVGRAWATKSVAGKVGRGAVKATALVAGMEFNSQLAARALGMESPGGIVSAAAASKALGRVEWNKDEFGRFQVAMDQAIPGTLELLPQGFVDAFIEVGSELSGGVLLKGAKSAFAKAGIKHGIKDIPLVNMLHGMQMKAAEKWLGKGGKHTMEALLEIAERGKFHGVMGEYLEERAGAMGRATVGLIPGWEDDFAGFDDVFPGVIDSAAELTAFSVIPIGAAGIGAANEIRIRHAEKNMSQSEILLSRAVREAKRAQGEAGTDGTDAAAKASLQEVFHKTLEDLTHEDILLQKRSYKFSKGRFLPEEIEELMLDTARLRGNAGLKKQVDIGHGVPGAVDRELSGAAFDANPVAMVKIYDTIKAIFDGNLRFAKGKGENVETDKARGRRFGSIASGVDAAKRLIGLTKSMNIGEANEKMAAILLSEVLGPTAKVKRESWMTDRDYDAAILAQTFKEGGSARMTKEVVDELRALGSLVKQGIAEESYRKVRHLEALLEKKRESGESEGAMKLGSKLKEAQKEFAEAELEQAQAGFQQFIRLEMTADGASYMPEASRWFRETFSANHPEYYERMKTLEEVIYRFRMQGKHLRAQVQSSDMNDPKNVFKEKMKLVKTAEGRAMLKQVLMEEAIGSEYGVKPFADHLKSLAASVGEQLKISEDPFLLDQINPGLASAMRDASIYDHPLTWKRKKRLDVRPLVAIKDYVKGDEAGFSKYLLAKRAVAIYLDRPAQYNEEGELVKYGGEPGSRKTSTKSVRREAGMGFNDANGIIAEAPEGFAEASDILYKWWDAVLDFLEESSEAGQELVGRMRQRDPGYYVALARELDDMPEGTNALGTIGLSALMADLTKTLDGSMEKVGPVFKNMVSLSGKVYDMAFEMNLQEVIYQASQRDGMEDFVTILSADQVEAAAPTAMKMLMELQEKLHQQAQEEENVRAREDGRRPQEIDFKGNLMAAFAGIAKMNEIENDEKLMAGRISIKKDAPEPVNNEARNIIPIKTPEGEIVYMQILNAPLLRWYQHRAAPERVDALSNAMNLHKKLFTFSTTTARVLFQWFRNPVKDIGTAVLNTRTSGSAGEYMIHALGAILSEFRVAFNTALGKDPKLNEYQDLFMRLGLEWSTELAADSVYGRSLVRKLAGGKKGKFELFWDTTLGFLQAPEKGVRTAELELYSKEMMEAKSLDSLDELSMDQMLELTLAAKQVSTNFTVAGRTSKKMNRWIPFFNAQIQGPRDTFRAIMAEGDADRRSDKILRAISFYTIPALVAWWWVKDEDWYIELTPREKASSWFIPVGGDEFLVLPLPFEIGTIFSAMPITFVDAAYRENPGETDWVVSRLIAATTQSGSFAWDSMPNMAPPLARTYMDVSSNNKSYWDTPIVSASMMRLEKKAQYDEFTTHLARWIGKSAGELGINDGSGWSPKVIEHIAKGLTGPLGLDVMETLSGTDAKEMEGLHTLPIVGKQFKEALAYPKSVTKLYETYNKVQMRFDTKVHEESEDEMNVRLALRDAIKAVSSIGLMLRRAEGDMRTALKEERLRIAKDGLRIYAEGKIESGLKTELRKRRKELETEKKRIKTSIIEERQASLGN